MNQSTIEYIVKCDANRLNEIISKELKRKVFNKKFNLSGEYSNEGGFDICNTISFFVSNENFGPFVKINLKSVSTNKESTESKLILKTIKGATFQILYWFSIFFSIMVFIVSIYEIFKNGFNEILSMILLIIFGLIFMLIIELIAKSTASNLISRIERLMTSEKIEFKKII